MTLDGVLSTAEVARILSLTTRQVHRFAADGTLTPVHRMEGKTGAYLFAEADVWALREQRIRAGLQRYPAA